MNTILLVEDDLGNRTVIQDIFQFDDIGANLSIAETGEAAMVLAYQLKPILILMDIRLPGIDGLEVVRTLKQDPQTKDIPVWAITAYARTEDRSKALAAGCNDYVTKPFERSKLVKQLREFVASLVRVGSSHAEGPHSR
jgi:CheY-like chemotaxis protein